MSLQVHQFQCLSDNYGFLIHDPVSGDTASVDTPEASVINAALADKQWKLTHILNTHHHFDHAGGNEELKAKWGCKIVGFDGDFERIPGIDQRVRENDLVEFGGTRARVIEVSGHTSGHIAYHFEPDQMVFVGDTMFALGCGRLFEGTPGQMWDSLQKLMALKDETVVYCAHEYTQANASFALSVEPENQDLVDRCNEIDRLRSQNLATVPTSIGLERKTNPFVRPASVNLQSTIGMVGALPVDVFAETRRLKDNF